MRGEIENHFGNCKFQYKCLCTLKDSFEFTEEKQFFVYDEKGTEQPVKIVAANAYFQLTVNNPNSKVICLIKTDNCLLGDDTRKCDCILFDDSKLFFVEIKSVSKSGRNKSRKNAIEQLGITVNLFKDLLDKNTLTAVAVICFRHTEPRIINTSAKTASVDFLTIHKIRLTEMNIIDFK